MEDTLTTKPKVKKLVTISNANKPKLKPKLKPLTKKTSVVKSDAKIDTIVSEVVDDNVIASTSPLKRVRRTKEELKDVYIDPIEMERKIKEFYDTGILSENLAGMVQMIAVRLGLARNFYSYSFKVEMQGDAIVKMMTALRRRRFKVDSGYNPFSYFTKVAYHAFQNCIKKNKKDFDTIKRYQEEMYENYICSGLVPSRKNTHVESVDDYTSDGHFEG